MKKFITLLIGGSLALAVSAAMAQQADDQQQSNKKAKKDKTTETTAGQAATGAPTGTETKPVKQGLRHERREGKAAAQENAGGNANTGASTSAETGATKSDETGAHAGRKGHGGKHNADAETGMNANANEKTANPETGANVGASTDVNVKGEGRHAGRDRKGRNKEGKVETATQAATAAPAGSAAAQATTTTTANGAANVNANANINVNAQGRVRGHGKGGKVLDEQVVQKVRTEHASFRAQARPDKVPTVTFNQSYRIQGAEQWQGPKYNVYRSYHPERHDRGWYSSHYNRVELIGGGYYYWNEGYWYPAWGYDTGHEYYAYDAPIYVGQSAQPPDKVIADVQAILQDAGYYTGEVDGLLGPLTREALTAYQSDNGLYTTAVIDEPTLDSLGLS